MNKKDFKSLIELAHAIRGLSEDLEMEVEVPIQTVITELSTMLTSKAPDWDDLNPDVPQEISVDTASLIKWYTMLHDLYINVTNS